MYRSHKYPDLIIWRFTKFQNYAIGITKSQVKNIMSTIYFIIASYILHLIIFTSKVYNYKRWTSKWKIHFNSKFLLQCVAVQTLNETKT